MVCLLQVPPTPGNILWLLGFVLLLVATRLHGLTATAGESMPSLYAVLLFLPAPVVYVWLRIIPDAGHTQGIRRVREEYEARVGAFFTRWLR
jgi:hypothetical protein